MSIKRVKLMYTGTAVSNHVSTNKPTILNSATHNTSYHNITPNDIQQIQLRLIDWYTINRRKLPWRGDTCELIGAEDHGSKSHVDTMNVVSNQTQVTIPCSAYGTWISEVMLQQTRVDTVVQYWIRWMMKYPTIDTLANSTIDDINMLWAGLGYYRRAKYIYDTAQLLHSQYNNQLPDTLDDLLKLPGIGRYTAGAIVSIAYNKPAPIVDGNVIRILSRIRAIDITPDHKQGNILIWKLSEQLVSTCDSPSRFNQGMMELGATVCTTHSPLCHLCPVQSLCHAYHEVQHKQRPINIPHNNVINNHEIITIDDDDDDDSVHHDSTVNSSRSVDSPDLCSICDIERCHIPQSVTQYPRKSIKTKQLTEYYVCSVITRTKVDNHKQYMMIKRPDAGLLAGQYEFVCIPCDSDTNDNERQQLLYIMLCELLQYQGNDINSIVRERRYIGELSHVFSHRIHQMYIDTIELMTECDISSIQSRVRFVDVNDITSIPLTTGVKKILQLVNK